MTKSSGVASILFFIFLTLESCSSLFRAGPSFDQLNRTIDIGNWHYVMRTENQSDKKPDSTIATGNHYLRVSVYISNTKTEKSLLYSVSKDAQDYEEKYRYLSFDCRNNLYLQLKDEKVYPIGYVFEPSNGLSPSERLVYKFQIGDDLYKKFKENSAAVEYWYVDRLSGIGKICFKLQ